MFSFRPLKDEYYFEGKENFITQIENKIEEALT